MDVLGGVGILLGFVLLVLGAWKKVDLLIVTLVVSAVIALFSGMDIGAVWSGPYMDGFTGFAGKYLLLFCAGALFGKILEDSGAGWRLATAIANKAGEKWSLFAFCSITLVLLYGGVSIFVIIFFILPIGISLFKKLGIPWSYFPGIALIGTIPAVAMLPGTLQLLNIIPTKYLGTTLMAAPLVGLSVSVLYVLLSVMYVRWILKGADQHFELAEFNRAASVDYDEAELDRRAPGVILSALPIITALVLINGLKIDIIYGLLIASVVGILCFYQRFDSLYQTINNGISQGIMPLIYVAVIVGVAKTVAAVPFFEVMKELLLTSSIPGLFKVIATTSVLSAMTGSSSGSMTMILEMFGNDFLSWGYHPELLHRLISVSAIGLDSLPWNSVIVVFFTLSGVSYAKGYKHVFMTTVVLPVICTLAIVAIAPVFY